MQKYFCEKLFINHLTLSGLFVTSHKASQEQCTLIYFLRLTLVGGHILYELHVANCPFACDSLLPVTGFSACTTFSTLLPYSEMEWAWMVMHLKYMMTLLGVNVNTFYTSLLNTHTQKYMPFISLGLAVK